MGSTWVRLWTGTFFFVTCSASSALADDCANGELVSRGHCCPAKALWDARYQVCADDPQARCSAGDAALCVVVGDHYTDPASAEFRPRYALPYYRKACALGRPWGLRRLGTAFDGQCRER